MSFHVLKHLKPLELRPFGSSPHERPAAFEHRSTKQASQRCCAQGTEPQNPLEGEEPSFKALQKVLRLKNRKKKIEKVEVQPEIH